MPLFYFVGVAGDLTAQALVAPCAPKPLGFGISATGNHRFPTLSCSTTNFVYLNESKIILYVIY